MHPCAMNALKLADVELGTEEGSSKVNIILKKLMLRNNQLVYPHHQLYYV